MDSILNHIVHYISNIPELLIRIGKSRRMPIQNWSPLMVGIVLQTVVIIGIVVAVRYIPHTRLSTTIILFFDTMYEFFEEIVGKQEKRSIKLYIVSLFFIIFSANILGYLIDLIRVVFVDIERIFKYIQIPTTSFNFNLSLALVSIILMLFIQLKHLKPIRFVLEYIPITGKGILDIQQNTVPIRLYYPAKVVVKLFDIAISLFVGFLDIVGIFAKVLSLTARLYGNMMAGGILLGLLVMGINSVTQNIASINFPVLVPLILYAQGLLVALIQAFVFPLLVAIFIKIAQGNE